MLPLLQHWNQYLEKKDYIKLKFDTNMISIKYYILMGYLYMLPVL
jgi:hypothetical protein